MHTANLQFFLKSCLILTASALGVMPTNAEVRIPGGQLSELKSAEFKIRERAETMLLAWGRKNPGEAKDKLFEHSQQAEDPEVRERCLNILRELVADEYLIEGEGYIGIGLGRNDEVIAIPGAHKERRAIRVTEVKANSPGQRSGIRANDLIVELEGEEWHAVEANPLFRERIKKMKPTSVASLTVLREGELIEIRVTLCRRPLMADMLLHQPEVDPDALEIAAREAHFGNWLARKKSGK